jgi:ABC-type uncharacterized transport system permease subunit
MSATLASNLGAIVSLTPLLAQSLRPRETRDAVFWAAVLAGAAGPGAWTAVQLAQGWNAGISVALWIIVSVTMMLFALAAGTTRAGWRLAVLLGPYLFLLAVLAALWQTEPARPFAGNAPAGWIELHILVSVLAYGLLTLASVAGLAVFLQERALKQKRRSSLAASLPSIADGEALQLRLLWGAAAGLAIGLLSGMGTEYFEIGRILKLDHKTILSFLTFAVILALLVAHNRTGLRGRRAARLVLLAYLLLTLSYPGVKFVTDVLMS